MAARLLSRHTKELIKRSNVKAQPVTAGWRRHYGQVKHAEENQGFTQLTQLSNGVRIATETLPMPTATVGLWIDAGSRLEDEKNNGTAHFLEHMAFKGTQRRTRQQLELEVENMGAHLNAYTSREQTTYYAKCFDKDVEKCVDILADIIQNSKLDENDIEMERGVILREMEEVNTNIQEVVFDDLHATAYQGTPLSMSILGPEKNINSITKPDLLAYIKQYYKGSKIVLAAAGGIDHNQVVDLAEKYLGNISNEGNVPTTTPCRFTGSELRMRDDDMPFAHFAMAVEACGSSSSDILALMVANTIVGAYDRSFGAQNNSGNPFIAKVAAISGVNSVQSFCTPYKDTGLWGIYAVCDRLAAEELTSAIQDEWIRLCYRVRDYEVARAKNTLKTSMLLSLDGSTAVCEDIGRQVLSYGRRMSPQELEERINSITTDKIKEVCQTYIYDKCLAVAGVGPIEGMPDYDRLRSQMYSILV